jgi:hypothetical protein
MDGEGGSRGEFFNLKYKKSLVILDILVILGKNNPILAKKFLTLKIAPSTKFWSNFRANFGNEIFETA